MKILGIAQNNQYIEVLREAAARENAEVFFVDSIAQCDVSNADFSIAFIELEIDNMEKFVSLRELIEYIPYLSIVLLTKTCKFEYSMTAMRVGVKNILVGSEITAESIAEIVRVYCENSNPDEMKHQLRSKYFERLVFCHDEGVEKKYVEYLDKTMRLFEKNKSYAVAMLYGLEFELTQKKRTSIQRKADRELVTEKIAAIRYDDAEVVFVFYIDNCFYAVVCQERVGVGKVKQLESMRSLLKRIYTDVCPILGKSIVACGSEYHKSFSQLSCALAELEKLRQCIHSEEYPIIQSFYTVTNVEYDEAHLEKITDECLSLLKNIDSGCDYKKYLSDIFSKEKMSKINYEQFYKLKDFLYFEFELLRKNKGGSLIANKQYDELLADLKIHGNYQFVKKIVEALAEMFTSSVQIRYNYLITKSLKIIEEMYSTSIGLYDVAKRLDISAVYLSQLFKKETGKKFVSYVMEYRLNRAKEFIDEGYKIAKVCEMVGMNNVQYFSNSFKKMFGMTPNEYKNRKNK